MMRNELRDSFILCGTLVFTMCAGCTAPRTSPTAENVGQPAVAQFGAMREVMREGHTESRIGLTDAVARPHAFAVGALEGLAGEIMIVDGRVWVSRTVDGELQVTGPAPSTEDRATLLTLTHVASWQTVTIETLAEGHELESLIEETARAGGLDTARPFPFVIEGDLTSIDLHVISGYCPIATDPATVDAQPWRWSNPRQAEVVIVGFYAPDAAGMMTHHGTSVHAHAILTIDGRTLAGHVDRVVVEPGMTLRLPAAE